MEDADKFDERSHGTERLRIVLRYSLAAVAMFSAGVSQCQCGDSNAEREAYSLGFVAGENETLKKCLEKKY